ncbi:MAG: glycoside hydrolase family 127 protein [Candidatus Aminicenantes bacterium]|nr:glycoside hydrolase family 127 protein [Candidatus Aminicenantes bacterium]
MIASVPKPAFAFLLTGLGCLAVLTFGAGQDGASPSDYPYEPVPFTAVRLTDAFWLPRIETNRTVTVPYLMAMNEKTGRVDNFRKAAGLMTGPHTGKRYNDSDIFKIMEAAAYSLMARPDPALDKELDDLIAVIGKAQEPDGYLYTARRIDPANPPPGAGAERWSNLRVSHELYNVGHMYEAAVAHYQATGKTTFLDIAVKNADFLLATFGPGKRRGFPGHQEIEIGLARLYRATGRYAYIELARFFLDERGRYYQGESYPPDSPFAIYNSDEYLQNHKPVLLQDEAVGHAVRAAYMFSGMADVAALTGSPEYVAAIDRLWNDVVSRKMYLTGGIGAKGETEAFGDAYELPNREAYTETCAAVGNAFWNQRLFLLHGDAKSADVLERIIYNGLLSGVSLSGDRFFYQNPLASAGGYGRSPFFEVACCPANVARFLPSLAGYIYARQGDDVYVNLFIPSETTLPVGDKRVVLRQASDYPWDGAIRIAVEPEAQASGKAKDKKPAKVEFRLFVRIPGWARNEVVPGGLYAFLEEPSARPALKVNGRPVRVDIERGYAGIRRAWMKGDVVELALPMDVRRVVARDEVVENLNKVALQRGPLVYCVEAVDNGGKVLDLTLPDAAALTAKFEPKLLHGVVRISGRAVRAGAAGGGPSAETAFSAVPYYAWANRGDGEMAVWLPRQEK